MTDETKQESQEPAPEDGDVAIDKALSAEDTEITKPQTVLSNAYRGRKA